MLDEFLPDGMKAEDAPHDVVANVTVLVQTLLQPLRDAMDVPLEIHSGWRPPTANQAAGGVVLSDHLIGAAADFHAGPSDAREWEDMTFAAFDWLREHRTGEFGQLIMEDHRAHYGQPGKLWIHVSLRSAKHDGSENDPNRLLVSSAPRQYEPWVEDRFV
jgi:hypothetical protein